MTVTSRARSATRWGLKMQRRIALTQALFWPVLLGSGLVVGAGVVLKMRQNSPATKTPTADPPYPIGA